MDTAAPYLIIFALCLMSGVGCLLDQLFQHLNPIIILVLSILQCTPRSVKTKHCNVSHTTHTTHMQQAAAQYSNQLGHMDTNCLGYMKDTFLIFVVIFTPYSKSWKNNNFVILTNLLVIQKFFSKRVQPNSTVPLAFWTMYFGWHHAPKWKEKPTNEKTGRDNIPAYVTEDNAT